MGWKDTDDLRDVEEDAVGLEEVEMVDLREEVALLVVLLDILVVVWLCGWWLVGWWSVVGGRWWRSEWVEIGTVGNKCREREREREREEMMVSVSVCVRK